MSRYRRRRRYRPYHRRPKYAWSGQYTTRGSVNYLARRAIQGVRYIKSMINCEKQYYDLDVSTTCATGGSVNLLTGMAQGDDVNQRRGNSILGKTTYIQGVIYRDVLNTTPTNFVRILVVRDLENTGTAPTVADFFQATGSGIYIQPINVDHTSRYQVLMDRRYTLLSTINMGRQLKFFIRCNGHVKYTGANATDVYKNNLYLIAVGDQGSMAPILSFHSRFAFYDN